LRSLSDAAETDEPSARRWNALINSKTLGGGVFPKIFRERARERQREREREREREKQSRRSSFFLTYSGVQLFPEP
jgi:hypothetical protein